MKPPSLIPSIRSMTAVAAAWCAVSSAQAYSSIIAFGDSLSDTGNVQARLNALGAGVDVPAAPYVDDRFSNGPVAVEVMAQALGVSLKSYAYGGAQTGLDNRIPAGGALAGTGLQGQVNQYIAGLGGASADASALYFLWGGANDLFSMAESASPNPALVISQAVTNLSSEVSQLYAQGAREFFLPLIPNLAYTYGALQAGPQAQATLTVITNLFNSALAGAMAQLDTNLAGATIHVFDPQPVLNSVRADLQAQGGVVDKPCWMGDFYGQNGTVCADPGRYYLFDAVHPTALVHQATGLAMAAAVPEPDSLALVLAGAGVAGAAWRRRTAAV